MKRNGKTYPTNKRNAINACYMLWSRVNQAWFIMWHDQVLNVITDTDDACAQFDYLTRRQ